ncbi:extracellular calcium-sensing receptor-like [Rhinoderma darwinii]|uniref:extracellular calcium-sensing receptor-like n=1 Tax=Rhinoderma darwinii TaxID=43563 RepID=UPI003F6737C3
MGTIMRHVRLDTNVIPGISSSGDVVIGGVFPVRRSSRVGPTTFHTNPASQMCDDSFDFRSFRWIRTMIYAIEDINNNTHLLPNISVGYAIYDTCDNIAEAVKQVFTLISGSGAEAKDVPNYQCQEKSALSAVIGESASVISIAMARILGTYRYPQLVNALKAVNFTDPAGNYHYFDKNGDPVAKYDVVNWQMGENGLLSYKKVGSYYGSTIMDRQLVINEQITLWNGAESQPPQSECNRSCKPGFRKSIIQGQPVCCFSCLPCPDGEISNGTDFTDCIKCPADYWSNRNRDACIPKEVDYLSFGEPLGITFSVAAVLGICQTILVIMVFIKYRNTPIVKANNLEMSFLLLVSLTLSFIGAFTFIGEPSTYLCVIRQTVFGISFVLSISCVLVKTLVVILAFTMSKPNQAVLKYFHRSHQRILVGFTTIIQIVICIGFLSSASSFTKKNRETVMSKIILECNRESELAFLVSFGYIGLLAVLCFILAFLARNLPDSFNEAKFITFSLLVFVMVWVSFIPGYASTSGKYVTAVEIFAILSSAAGLLACIFYPKCYIILIKPEKNSRKNLTVHPWIGK